MCTSSENKKSENGRKYTDTAPPAAIPSINVLIAGQNMSTA